MIGTLQTATDSVRAGRPHYNSRPLVAPASRRRRPLPGQPMTSNCRLLHRHFVAPASRRRRPPSGRQYNPAKEAR